MAGIKTAGGAGNNTKTGETLIKTPSGAGTSTSNGGTLIKTAGGSGVPSAGCEDINAPGFVLDDEDDF